MNYLFLLQIVTFNLLSCTSISNQNDMVTLEIKLDTITKNVNYKITNNSDDIIFLGKTLYLLKSEKDTILLECYPKSKLINFNQFIIPEMISLTKGKSIDGFLKVQNISTIENKQFFVRIFQVDDAVYFSKNKNPITENIYLKYELENSRLIKANN